MGLVRSHILRGAFESATSALPEQSPGLFSDGACPTEGIWRGTGQRCVPSACQTGSAPSSRDKQNRRMIVRPATLLALNILVAVPLSSACQGSVAPPIPLLNPGLSPHVVVERIDTGRWRATYRLEEPTRLLRFQRAAQFFREDAWYVMTPGFRMDREDGWQVIRGATEREPVDEIVVEFDEYDARIEKEYEFVRKLTDGSVAIYTGHLYARSSSTGAGPTVDESDPIRTVKIVPPDGHTVAVPGRMEDGALVLNDSIGNGTYAYVGSVEPVETRHLVAVVDPGTPEWIRTELHLVLPELFSEYSALLGAELPRRPMVLVSFGASDDTGYSSGGGTLTGLIEISVRGSAWYSENQQARIQLLRLLAHESAHLWNGQLVRVAADRLRWIHEGSAEALADAVLLELGLIDRTELDSRRVGAINNCFLDLEGRSVAQAIEGGTAGTYYTCGHLLAVWAELAALSVDPQADIFTVWRSLIRETGVGNTYDQADYFRSLAELGVSREDLAGMVSFVEERRTDAVEFVASRISELSLELIPAAEAPSEYRRELARRAMKHLMFVTCGRVSFYSGPVFSVGSIQDCKPFSEGLEINQIAGQSVAESGHILYDRVQEACESQIPIVIGTATDDYVTPIVCDQPLPPRPPSYEYAHGPG